MIWTPETCAQLIELWNVQKLTGEKIAHILGVTRERITGQMYRMRKRGVVFADHPIVGAWSGDMIETAIRMRGNGFSSTSIGRQLGLSRNAVIGKLARMGLSDGPRIKPKPIQKAKPVVQPPAPYIPAPPPVFVQASEPVPTVELKTNQCRYPVTDEAPWMHCGREGFPWCPEHGARIFNRQQPRSRL